MEWCFAIRRFGSARLTVAICVLGNTRSMLIRPVAVRGLMRHLEKLILARQRNARRSTFYSISRSRWYKLVMKFDTTFRSENAVITPASITVSRIVNRL